jgi:hypothetical protein
VGSDIPACTSADSFAAGQTNCEMEIRYTRDSVLVAQEVNCAGSEVNKFRAARRPER